MLKLFGLVLLLAATCHAFSIAYYLGTECDGDIAFQKRYDYDEHQCFYVPAIGSMSFECDEDTITLQEDYIHAVVTICNPEGKMRDCTSNCQTEVFSRTQCSTDGQISWTITCGASSPVTTLAVFLPVLLLKLIWF